MEIAKPPTSAPAIFAFYHYENILSSLTSLTHVTQGHFSDFFFFNYLSVTLGNKKKVKVADLSLP